MDPAVKYKIDEMEGRLESIETKVDRVLTYLDNDTATGREGLFSVATRNRRDIEGLDKEVREMKVRSAVDKVMWGGAGGGITAFILKFIEKLT